MEFLEKYDRVLSDTETYLLRRQLMLAEQALVEHAEGVSEDDDHEFEADSDHEENFFEDYPGEIL